MSIAKAAIWVELETFGKLDPGKPSTPVEHVGNSVRIMSEIDFLRIFGADWRVWRVTGLLNDLARSLWMEKKWKSTGKNGKLQKVRN
jgi:hypothetical protein